MLKKEEGKDKTEKRCYYEQFYASKFFRKLLFPEKKNHLSKLIHKEIKILKYPNKWVLGQLDLC